MNNLGIDESSIIGLKDEYIRKVKEIQEGIVYSCDIPFARYCQAKNEVEIIFRLWKEGSEKKHYALNKMKVDSGEFDLLLEHIYAVHHDIFAIDLNDFLCFEGYCEVKFINGYPKVIICDLDQTPVSKLTIALYGRGYDL